MAPADLVAAKASNMGTGKGGHRGVLITFEGIEGSGKTTQCTNLAKLLREDGHRVVETREPGGTPVAERIRECLLSTSAEPISPVCEAYLILASRCQHVSRVIGPALRGGAVVLCDRFSDSTLAYQGYGRGMNVRLLRDLDRIATGGLTPDLTLLFDIPVSAGLARRRRSERQHEAARNRFDRETRRFHERVRRGFLELAVRHPRRIRVLDGRPDPDSVTAAVTVLVRKFLKKCPSATSSGTTIRKPR